MVGFSAQDALVILQPGTVFQAFDLRYKKKGK